MPKLSAFVRDFILPTCLALALALGMYYQALQVAPIHRHSFQTFYELERIAPESLVRAWLPRIFAWGGAGVLKNYIDTLPQFPASYEREPPTRETIGIAQWQMLWFGLISLALILAFRQHAIYFILGTYACVAFGYFTGPDLRVYPWDLPALWNYTLVLALVHRRLPPWLIMLAVWVGMSFKETALMLSLFPLLLPLTWKRRLLYGGLTLLGCVAIKLAIDVFTQNSAIGLTMTYNSFHGDEGLWAWNLRELVKGYPLAINGGTLLALWLLPSRHRTVWVLKFLALGFAAGNLLFGVITEYRIWFELIPLALYAFGLEGRMVKAEKM